MRDRTQVFVSPATLTWTRATVFAPGAARPVAGVLAGMLLLTVAWVNAWAQGESTVMERNSSAPISIQYLTQRNYDSSLRVARKLGDFEGYSSYAVEWESDGLRLSALMNVPAAPAPPDGYPILIMNHGNAGNEWAAFRDFYSFDQDSAPYRERGPGQSRFALGRGAPRPASETNLATRNRIRPGQQSACSGSRCSVQSRARWIFGIRRRRMERRTIPGHDFDVAKHQEQLRRRPRKDAR